MSEKPAQRFTLTVDGRAQRVEIREGSLRREVSWYVDDVLVAQVRSSEDKLQLKPGAGLDEVTPDPDLGVLGLRFTMLGRPRRVTWFDGADAVAQAAVGIGGIDLDPEPGSAAAAYEQKVRDHPRRYAAQHTAGGVLKVVVPILIVYLLARFAFSAPLPDWNLPSIPWPDLPSIPWPDVPVPNLPDWELPGWVRAVLDKVKYVWPVLLAFVLARAEIRRRRTQDEVKAGLRAEEQTSTDDDGETR